MLRVVADDKIPFLKGALEQWADISYIPGNKIRRDDLVQADALLIRTRTKCTESLLEGTNVKFIGTATIGYDHIDTGYCDSNGIFWTNAPGCNSSSVRQYIASALFSIAAKENFSLKGKILGIIGVGNVGSKVERFARTLGMEVLLNDPPRARREGSKEFSNLRVVLKESDIVTVHVPLNLTGEDFTYHLFEADSFAAMKEGAWFINSSRGEVTDTADLIQALSSGKLKGAVIDVWENEPDINKVLMNQVFIATPHIAGYSTDGKANGTAMVVNSLSRFFNLPLNDWYPSVIPMPENHTYSLDCSGKSFYDVAKEAVNLSYNIFEDDHNLRLSPSDFEKLRGDYRVRREFPSFTISLINEHSNIRSMLSDLGFRIK